MGLTAELILNKFYMAKSITYFPGVSSGLEIHEYTDWQNTFLHICSFFFLFPCMCSFLVLASKQSLIKFSFVQSANEGKL